MKKGLITSLFCVMAAIFVWAQPKKPVVTQQKKTTTVTKKPTVTPQKKATPATVKTQKPAAAPAGIQASIARGNALYMRTCIACHQKDGGGVPRMNPPLIKTSYVLGDKTRLINIVLKGLNERIEIEDEEYSNPMPPQPQLTDEEVADVLTFVRNSFGNKASAVTPAEVKATRAKAK